jgi:hypothetical protein
MPDAIPYKILKQKHPSEYDGERFAQIEDLYEGGWRIMRKSPAYLPQLSLEHKDHYVSRCKTSSYQPYFGQILDQFVSDLFTQALTIQPASDADNKNTPGNVPDKVFYPALASNLDGAGSTLESVAGDLLTTALKHRRAYLMVDAPDAASGPVPESLAEEDAAGARRCYAYEVSPAQVIDWKWDDKKKAYEWVILATREQERASPTAVRNTIREQFTVWDLVGGVAHWARYAIEYTEDQPPREEDVVPCEVEGTTSFDRIPLLRFELPEGLWVGNKIGPQALEHWCRRSALIGAEGRSCVAIPYTKLGPELPDIGESTSEAQEDPHRGKDPVKQFGQKGFLVLGKDDDIGFAEPVGGSYEIIDKQLDALREGMYAVNHQMAASIRPTSAALGRSGLSKQKDDDKTAKVLGALGRLVRAFWTLVYDTISKARSEDVIWVPHGLDSYEFFDREQVLEESISLQLVNIPSPTFRKEHAKVVYKRLLPGMPPETDSQICDEIDEGVESEQELRDITQDAQKDAIENPPAPGTPAPKVPGTKPPVTKTPAAPKAKDA